MARPAAAAFGGGCHWCTEAVLQSFRGVARVEQGFAAGPPPEDWLSEAARAWWDPDALPFAVLIEAHLLTHSATSAHSLRSRYRSAIYVESDRDAAVAERVLDGLQPRFDAPLNTRVLPLARWERSSPRYRNYYATRPDAPFCRVHIAPKLAALRRRYGARVAAPGGNQEERNP